MSQYIIFQCSNRFGQRCGEVICNVRPNTERSMIEKLRKTEAKVKRLQLKLEESQERVKSLEAKYDEACANFDRTASMEENFPEGSEEFIRNFFSTFSFSSPAVEEVSDGM